MKQEELLKINNARGLFIKNERSKTFITDGISMSQEVDIKCFKIDIIINITEKMMDGDLLTLIKTRIYFKDGRDFSDNIDVSYRKYTDDFEIICNTKIFTISRKNLSRFITNLIHHYHLSFYRK